MIKNSENLSSLIGVLYLFLHHSFYMFSSQNLYRLCIQVFIHFISLILRRRLKLLFTASRKYCNQLGLCHLPLLPPLLCHHFRHYNITPTPPYTTSCLVAWCLQHRQFNASLGDPYKISPLPELCLVLNEK